MNPEPIVTVIRPALTAEERERRMEAVKEAVRNFWLAYCKANPEEVKGSDIERV